MIKPFFLKSYVCFNNYALGDKNKEADSVAEVDTTKIREAENVAENVEKKEVQERIEEAKRRSGELNKEPDGFETALNRVLGKKPDNLKKEVQSGILTPELNFVRNEILARVAKNMAKSLEKTAQKAFNKPVTRYP